MGIGDFLSSAGDVAGDILGGLGDIAGGVGEALGIGNSTSTSTDKSFLDSLLSPTGLTAVLEAGTSLLQGYQAQNLAEEKLKREEEDARFGALVELAKLKYQLASKGGGGGGRGGGGGGSDPRKKMIEILELRKRGEQDALAGLSSGIMGAYR